MNSLVNTNYSRTYNPSGRKNALSEIKRLLTSRDTEAQNKACGYLIDVISRYSKNSYEGDQLVDYLLDNDITVFLCDATSNLDFTLFRSILCCVRLLWRSHRFFAEEHGAVALAAALRALAHYAGSGGGTAVDACLHFLCDLLNGISANETTAPLSHQSAYSALQLLACLNALAPRINTNSKTILSSALVLHALISYQPDSLTIKSGTASALVEILNQWFVLLLGALNHASLVGDGAMSGMFLAVTCQLGMDVLRMVKLLHSGQQNTDFVQTILADDQEIAALKQCAKEMRASIHRVLADLVGFAQANQNQISTEEYSVFLVFLLNFLYDHSKSEVLHDFCDVLFAKGYLTMLPQVQISRNDATVRKVSTLVLGEMLKALSEKYLNVNPEDNAGTCARDIHMGLVELQYGMEKPQSIGMQLQKSQPYSLLIYIYFYSQSTENPDAATGPLLPHLVEHILRLPTNASPPPPYIIKALWLVFAMSTISNGSLASLDERVYLEQAIDRLLCLLHPDPSRYYTHHPAILLWAFVSQRIPNHIRLHVLSQWLKTENSLPSELTTEPVVWQLLLTILIQSQNDLITTNCMETLHLCLNAGDGEDRQQFATYIWSTLPTALSKVLIDCDSDIDKNICYLLDIATSLVPEEVDQTVCLKTAVLITTIFSKNKDNFSDTVDSRQHFEYVALKLSLYLLGMSNQSDNRVLVTFVNRAGFLQAVLTATDSTDDRVATMALQLLAYVVHYFTKNNYQPKSVLEIQTNLVIKSLRRDSSSERGSSILQLIYMVLSSGHHTPLVLSYDMENTVVESQQCNALRALMFRIQLMMCCRDSKDQNLLGWKTLTSIFRHAIVNKNDQNLIATLTSQPWTNTLIQFQLSQNHSEEFLTFTHSWLTLLKITIKKSQEERRIQMSKQSLLVKTLGLIKKNVVIQEDGLKEVKENILMTVREILELSNVKLKILLRGPIKLLETLK